MTKKYEKTDLDSAYELETPDDSRRLYRAWAESYDRTFAEEMRYIAPARLAALFLERAGADDSPVLDIGCGTGLVGEALDGRPLDGVDISPEMLAAARGKGCYRLLLEADLTRPLAFETAVYGGLISAGTFTHGHVGPEPLDELVRIARPGALFVLGINAAHYEAAGFAAAFDRLAGAGAITVLEIAETPIYAHAASHDHVGDTLAAALFRRAG